jgi:MFS family permease
MLHFFPSLFALLLLIPAGVFADSLKNKRRMISVMLLAAAVFFVVVRASAFVPVHTVYFFLLFFALAAVSVNGLYNLAWQAFFPEAVPETERNNVLTFRARMTMIVALIVPLLIGEVLTAIPSEQGKILTHQIFYVLAALLLVANAFHFRKIKAVLPAKPQRISFSEMKTAGKRLINNKQFIFFTLAILFFHMTWHFDWTLYFIGQATYLQMNERMLMLTPVASTVAQLLTLKFWSKKTAKQGADTPLTYGILGLCLNSVAMMVGTSIVAPFGMYVFLLLHFIAMFTFANITLNIFQCLLKVVDEKYRSFSISIYSCLIMLSNAIMPLTGVALYNILGGNLNALRAAMFITLVLRLGSTGLWVLRVKYFKRVGTRCFR